ncbi:MAG: Crp/Fnr family transcriptional regulator [Bacteroidales bacterium]|nr:Crp/Fnr family transcriptional regulator [Bacteroidales bacterium]
MYKTLSDSIIFKGLSESDIKNLLNKINYQIKKYKPKDIVALNGEECNYLIIILKGYVKGEMFDYSGKVIKIEDIHAPMPLAIAFIFGKNNKFPVTVEAVMDTELLIIHKNEFLKLFQSDVRILNNFLNAISNRSQFLSNKIRFLSFTTIKSKFAQYILELAKEDYYIVDLKQTQQQLAELFGVTRPSFARIVGEMQNEGLIKIEKKQVEILNKNALIELIK